MPRSDFSPDLDTVFPNATQDEGLRSDGVNQALIQSNRRGEDHEGDSAQGDSAQLDRLPQENVTDTDRYQILEPLGEGGMAIVYVAKDVRLRRTVALKCLKQDYQHNPDAKERFLKEAQIMASLRHQGAIPIYDIGVLPNGKHYYAMKRVSGQTLRYLLEQRTCEQVQTPYLSDRFVDIFRRVCQTMAIAHQDGIIHRDLKPENIMVDDFGTVYIMDWGLAKFVAQEEKTAPANHSHIGTVMGTPSYMSPEQARGEDYASDTQSDVFSLGVILYEILTGVQPFRAKSSRDSIKGVIYFHPQEPHKLNPRISHSIAEVCMKALNKEPSQRYPSAAELAQDIQRYREFRPVSATKPSVIDRLRYWARRHPAHAVLAGVLCSLGIAVAINLGYESFQLVQRYRSLDTLQMEISDLNQQIKHTHDQLHQSGVDPSTRTLLNNFLTLLESKRDLSQAMWGWSLWAIVNDNYLVPKSYARQVAKEKFANLFDTYLESGEFYRARLLVEFLLTSYSNKNILELNASEVEYLNMKLVEVEELIRIRERSLKQNDESSTPHTATPKSIAEPLSR